MFDFSRIVASSYDKTMRAWDVKTGKLLVCMPCHSEGATVQDHDWALVAVGLDLGLGTMAEAPASGEDISSSAGLEDVLTEG